MPGLLDDNKTKFWDESPRQTPARLPTVEEVIEEPVWARAEARVEEQIRNDDFWVSTAPLRRKMPAYVRNCRLKSLAFAVEDEGDVSLRMHAYLCGSWRCKDCRRFLGRMWFNRVKRAMEENPYTWTGTMTFRVPEKETMLEEFDARADKEAIAGPAWSGFILDFKRRLLRGPSNDPKHGNVAAERRGTFDYIKFSEWTRRGYIHAHWIARGVPKTYWVSKKVGFGWKWEQHDIVADVRDKDGKLVVAGTLTSWCRELGKKHGFGWRNEIDRVRDQDKIASYLVTHVLKAYQLRPDYRPGLRRISASRSAYPKQEKKTWKSLAHDFIDQALESTEAELLVDGGIVSETVASVLVDEHQLPSGVALDSFKVERLGEGHREGICKITGEVYQEQTESTRRANRILKEAFVELECRPYEQSDKPSPPTEQKSAR